MSSAEVLRRSDLLDASISNLQDRAPLPQHLIDKGYIGPRAIASEKNTCATLVVPPTRSTKITSAHACYKIKRVGTNTQDLA